MSECEGGRTYNIENVAMEKNQRVREYAKRQRKTKA